MTSKHLVCGLAFAAVMIAALPAAKGIGASTKETANVQVNRAAKGDRLAASLSIVVRKPPEQTPRPPVPHGTERQAQDHGWLRAVVQSGDHAVDGAHRWPLCRLSKTPRFKTYSITSSAAV